MLMCFEINGWEVGKLAHAMKGCDIGNTGSPLDSPQCFGAGALRSSAEADQCRGKTVFPEDVGLLDPLGIDGSGTIGGALAALPGCNPIQSGPQRATKQTCSGLPVKPVNLNILPIPSQTPSVTTSTASKQSTPTPVPVSTSKTASSGSTAPGVKLPPGWTYSGCFSDHINPRSLGTQGEWWGEAMTSTGCVAHCKSIGKAIAGTENGGQCFCGNELKQSQAAPGGCDEPCDGDAGQMCGGSGTLSIFRKSTSVKPRHRRHRLGRSVHRFVEAS